MSKIRVLIVEDSDVVRRLLEHIVRSDERMEVAASAATAEEALRLLPTLKPDVISMDINLPGMDGLEATHRIMTEQPTPIVIISSSVSSEEARTSLEALRAGALAVSEKPVAPGNPRFELLSQQIVNRLALMSEVSVIRQRHGRTWRVPVAPGSPQAALAAASGGGSPPFAAGGPRDAPYRYLSVVASTGGPQALVRLFSDLGPTLAVPVLLVQHITAAFVDSFAHWLNGAVPQEVLVAEDGVRPEPGRIYLAPAECHLVLRGAAEPVLRTEDAPPIKGQRPSGTALLESLARTVGKDAIGVLLTGMGDDGAEGLLALRRAGGYTIAEDATTAVVYGMPAAAVNLGAASESLPLPEIGPRIRLLLGTENVRA